jgi:hypothetical protein
VSTYPFAQPATTFIRVITFIVLEVPVGVVDVITEKVSIDVGLIGVTVVIVLVVVPLGSAITVEDVV